jgi:4-amino-4-deoxy-L-arabinose transferase-like glycosyltransferase
MRQRRNGADKAKAAGSPKPGVWRQREWLGYAGVFLLAAAVRALYLAQLRHSVLFEVLLGDGKMYDDWARRIVGGDWLGREVFFEVPLYPYFMAVLYKLFGPEPMAVRAAQVMLGAGSCLALALASRQFFSRRVGILAGVLLAVYPPAIFYGGLLHKSALDLFFITLLLWLLGQFLSHGSGWKALLAGLVLSCFVLTRENALVLYPLIALWMGIHLRTEPVKRRLSWVGAFTAGTASLLLLVGWHNKMTGGSFQPTASSVGVNFYYGNSRQSDGRYFALAPWRGNIEFEHQDKLELAEMESGRKLTMGEMSEFWWKKALAEIRADPGRWCRLMAGKWLLTWNRAEVMDTESILLYREHSWLLRLLGMLDFGVVCPLALCGVWLTRGQWRRLWVLYGVVLGFAGAVALFVVAGRYRLPVVPPLLLFAAAGVWEMVAVARRRQRRPLGWAVVILAVSGVGVNWKLLSPDEELASTHSSLGVALLRNGEAAKSIAEFKAALRIRPDWTSAANNLAWIYATHGDAELRNGAEAVLLGEQACRATGFKDPMLLDTLAAAYAEAGRFQEAVSTAQRGIELATGARDRGLQEKLRSRLELYRSQRPYRMNP